MAEPIVNPEIPYVGDVPGGLQPGKMIRIQGVTHPDSDRFNINLATGPNNKPRDDTALHLSIRLKQGYVARNTYKDGGWGDEQGKGRLPIGNAQSFEIILLIDPAHYKIAINGQHFCEFPHRIPFQDVTHILIDGDVSITLISFEGIALPGGLTASQASPVHAEGPQGAPQFGGPQYGPPPGGYGPPPPNFGGYGPPPPPGAEPQSQLGGFFEQAQDILAGAIKSGAAEKLLGGILHSGGGPQQQQQGYAPQNARYGIYPDLPTQDSATLPPQNTGKFNEQDSVLSGIIAGSGGTITTGPQPIPPRGESIPGNQNVSGGQQPGPLEGLLQGFLGNKGGQTGGNQPTGDGGDPRNQSAGADLFSGLLSSLLNANKQGDQPGAQNPSQYGGNFPQNPQGGGQPPNAQGGTSDMLSGILQSLLSPNKGQQGPGAQNQPPYGPQSTPNAQGGQGQGSDALSGLLTSLLTSNQNQQNPGAPNQPPQGPNQGGGDILSNILQNLVSGGNQQTTAAGQNVPPQNYNQPPPNLNQSQNPQGQGAQNNSEMLTNLLQGLLSKAGDNTRPIQETYPGGGGSQTPGPAQNPQQQYGQYPHPPQQDQKGPMESLLSGLLSGGGQQQPQQPHVPQVGGEGSVGGLGSMGGILGSLAGSLLHRPTFTTTPSGSLYPRFPSAPLNPTALSYPLPKPIGLIPPEAGLLTNSGLPQPSHPSTPQCSENRPPSSAGIQPGTSYLVQHLTGIPRTMHPVQPVGFSGYPFPTVLPSSHGISKKSKKSELKKAMKYGLPILGVGVAAYTVSKASKKAKKAVKKGFNSSSSSSSSSSSDSD